eukprot:6385353-Amphidinium_carterae.1
MKFAANFVLWIEKEMAYRSPGVLFWTLHSRRPSHCSDAACYTPAASLQFLWPPTLSELTVSIS